MPKIGEMAPDRTDWNDNRYIPMFDASDPANPDPKMSLGSLRTAAAEFTNKALGAGTSITADHTTTAKIGTAGARITVTERGDGVRHKSILDLAGFAVGNSADNLSLGLGAVFYTFPNGPIIVHAAHVAVGLTIADAVKSDTPELGIGTVVASGAISVLGGTPTFENVFEGTAVAGMNGQVLTGFKLPTAGVPLLIGSSDPHTLYLNVADGWSNLDGPSAITATGRIVLMWDFI